MSKPCNVCDGTGWIDDQPKTWASEPSEHLCPACLGRGELDEDAPDVWDERDWIDWRQQEKATDDWLDQLDDCNWKAMGMRWIIR